MTVRDLIAALTLHDMDTVIVAPNDEMGGFYEVTGTDSGWMSKRYEVTFSERQAKRLKNPRKVLVIQ